jgi:hypothetical protein
MERKIYQYGVHKSRSRNLILRQTNPVLTFYSVKIHFNIILPSTLPIPLILSGFTTITPLKSATYPAHLIPVDLVVYIAHGEENY